MKYILILFLSIFFVSCCFNSTKKEESSINQENIKSDNDFVFKYRKTACFGACAVFNLTINSNGKMLYNGFANVKNIGSFQSILTESELKDLIFIFEKNDFWNLDDKYTDHVTDLPSTFITYKKGSKVKEIEDYYGAPKKLKEIENYIDNLIDKKDWKVE